MKNLFQAAIARENDQRPPVWFMRQAGRYHSHYQALRKRYSFIELCKLPEVACEATLGPVRDFGFDAGILFSDLLFPLEAMGMGLTYDEGPKLDWHLRTRADLAKLKGGVELASHMQFQADAMRLIRAALPAEKGLLGFVGGPLTLFFYAVEGSHKGELRLAKEGLRDGRFEGFMERIVDLLAENMALQARAGADTIAMLDTCAGDADPETYAKIVIPATLAVMERFQARCPATPITYYSKGTGPDHWKSFVNLPIGAMGIDWNHNLAQVLNQWGERYAVQGNVDPTWLFLEAGELEGRLRKVFEEAKSLPAIKRRGWISGLGHGVLPKTPESSVHLFLKLQHEYFG